MNTESGSLSRIRFAILVLSLAVVLASCQRVQRPFAGNNAAPADAPTYTVGVDLNGTGGRN